MQRNPPPWTYASELPSLFSGLLDTDMSEEPAASPFPDLPLLLNTFVALEASEVVLNLTIKT